MPQGLSFDPETRILSGTPAVAGTFRLRCRARDRDGDTTNVLFDIASHPCTFENQTISDLVYTVDEPIPNHNLPHSKGDCDSASQSIDRFLFKDGTEDTDPPNGDPTLPTGLTVGEAGSNKFITGTPTRTTAPRTYVWKAKPRDDTLGQPFIKFRIYSGPTLAKPDD